ncbi:MAG TPA: hypothetical protein VMT94_01825 [Burkholderiales bacterium]|nr:hypothetical protein [Burkholderiales bacterium]
MKTGAATGAAPLFFPFGKNRRRFGNCRMFHAGATTPQGPDWVPRRGPLNAQ